MMWQSLGQVSRLMECPGCYQRERKIVLRPVGVTSCIASPFNTRSMYSEEIIRCLAPEEIYLDTLESTLEYRLLGWPAVQLRPRSLLPPNPMPKCQRGARHRLNHSQYFSTYYVSMIWWTTSLCHLLNHSVVIQSLMSIIVTESKQLAIQSSIHWKIAKVKYVG